MELDLKACLIFAFHHPVLVALQGGKKGKGGKEVNCIKKHIPAWLPPLCGCRAHACSLARSKQPAAGQTLRAFQSHCLPRPALCSALTDGDLSAVMDLQ